MNKYAQIGIWKAKVREVVPDAFLASDGNVIWVESKKNKTILGTKQRNVFKAWESAAAFVLGM